MKRNDIYTTLSGERIDLAELDGTEAALVGELQTKQAGASSYADYANCWMEGVMALCAAKGLNRQQAVKTDLYKIARDLGSRLMVRLNEAAPPHDYRDDLEGLIRERFQTRRGFCEATGISEDMLSHVLAHRKHLAVDTLGEALHRIGYHLRILPIESRN